MINQISCMVVFRIPITRSVYDFDVGPRQAGVLLKWVVLAPTVHIDPEIPVFGENDTPSAHTSCRRPRTVCPLYHGLDRHVQWLAGGTEHVEQRVISTFFSVLWRE